MNGHVCRPHVRCRGASFTTRDPRENRKSDRQGRCGGISKGPKKNSSRENIKGSPSLTIGCFIASSVWDVDLFGSFVVLTASKQSLHWFGLFLHRCRKPQVQSGHRDVQEQPCGREQQVRLSFSTNALDSLRVACLVIPVKFRCSTQKYLTALSLRSCVWKIIVLIGSVQDVYENQRLGTTTPGNLSFCPSSSAA